MKEVVLKYTSSDGPDEIVVGEERIYLGRGSDAQYRFDDNGVSRLHASIYREDDYIWIIDENSTYGTFVNGEKVEMSGSPLHDGDEIKIGHDTILQVTFIEDATDEEDVSNPESTASQTVSTVSESETKSSLLIPLAITGVAFLVITASIVFIGVIFLGNGNTTVASDRREYRDDYDDEEPEDSEDSNENNNEHTTATPAQTPTRQTADTPTSESPNGKNITEPPIVKNTPSGIKAPTGKTYLQMSDSERSQYIAVKAMRIARLIGNQSSDSIPPLAVARIKGFTIGYAKRIRVARRRGCRFGDNLQATYERARQNAPFIVRAFNQQGIAPQIGLYLAMIESEHCVCLQSPTGPLGMFQFTRATGRTYGLDVRRGASPKNPDERCKPEPAASAAAKYMKFLTGRYGTGPSSVPLAIGSYNSGEGGLSKNLKVALKSNKGLPRDFWSMIANGEKLSKQFQSENFKYVPKFFAAAIVGENPRDFGLSLQPLSTYSK